MKRVKFVDDDYGGWYEAQVRGPWYWPFWRCVKMCDTKEQARLAINSPLWR